MIRDIHIILLDEYSSYPRIDEGFRDMLFISFLICYKNLGNSEAIQSPHVVRVIQGSTNTPLDGKHSSNPTDHSIFSGEDNLH